MNDLLAGLGIALVLEGLLWALAPGSAKLADFGMVKFSLPEIPPQHEM